MNINYPPGVTTAEQKTAYLYRLYELVRIDGNTNGWTTNRSAAHDLIIDEILINRAILKADTNNPASLGDIDGY